MRNALIIGGLVFAVLLISQAPVGLVRWLVGLTGQATLLQGSGTLWHGQGKLLVQKESIGFVTWDLQGVTILQGKLGYDVILTDEGQDVTADVKLGFNEAVLTLNGTVNYVAVNRWLAPYNIDLSGDFALADVTVHVHDSFPDQTTGQITWTGGPVTYQLAGTISTGVLPEMIALLGPGPQAAVFPAGGQTPLLQAELQENGFARIGVTKLLTKMLNTPWPGADPDHEVVLEVEEQVF